MAGKRVYDVLIALSASESGAIDLSKVQLASITIPASTEGTTLTLTTSKSQNGTYTPVNDEAGTALSMTVAAGQTYTFNDKWNWAIATLTWVKFDIGSNQTGAAATLELAVAEG